MPTDPKAMPAVNSFNEWDPLEEVIVGIVDGATVPPSHVALRATLPGNQLEFFREHAGKPFPVERITAANRDLEEFVHLLEAEGVRVRRPQPAHHHNAFGTPGWTSTGLYAAMPRDTLLVIGNHIIECPMAWRARYFETTPYRALLKEYFQRGAQWSAAPKPELCDALYDYDWTESPDGKPFRSVITEYEPVFDAADFIRCGRDIFAQRSMVTNDFGIAWLRRYLGPSYRIHVCEFVDSHPMHIDATLMPLAPGKLLINPERVPQVPVQFKGWDVYHAPRPAIPADHTLYMTSPWINMNILMLDEQRVVVERSDLGLSSGAFFPREVYGVDRLVTGDPIRSLPTDVPAALHHGRAPADFLADCPIVESQRAKLLALFTDPRDVLAGNSIADKQQLLSTLSYRDYQQRYFGLDDRSLAMFGGRTLDLFARKTEAVPAISAWACGLPGFQGLRLPAPTDGGEAAPYIYHFPDGNASLARLFVRALIPGVAPGRTMDDIVTATFDYARLDVPGNPVRLRLSSTVVALANTPRGVDLLYANGRTTTRVTADHAIYCGYAAMLPYICADLGSAQRSAVSLQVKAPLVYVNIAIRNWRSWVNCGIHYVNNPAGFYSHLKLDYPVTLGDYRFPTRPDEPMILHLVHVPWPDGPFQDLRAAWRAARALTYARSFQDFESHARDELSRILGPGGFDAERDLAAITVNRWGHGYAYEFDLLHDSPALDRSIAISATALGRIHFAGTDAAWMAYAQHAIASAQRAVTEIVER